MSPQSRIYRTLLYPVTVTVNHYYTTAHRMVRFSYSPSLSWPLLLLLMQARGLGPLWILVKSIFFQIFLYLPSRMYGWTEQQVTFARSPDWWWWCGRAETRSIKLNKTRLHSTEMYIDRTVQRCLAVHSSV
jgi:hypothetical protein